MAKMSYAEQLKHPNWQRKRLEKLESAGWECEDCGTTDVTLHVHHLRYAKGRMAWECEDADLAVLCEECHERAHESRKLLDELLTSNSGAHLDACVALIAGFLYGGTAIEDRLANRARLTSPIEFDIGVVAAALNLLLPCKDGVDIVRRAVHPSDPNEAFDRMIARDDVRQSNLITSKIKD